MFRFPSFLIALGLLALVPAALLLWVSVTTPTLAAGVAAHGDCDGGITFIEPVSGDLATYDAGADIITGVCIKAGLNMFGGEHSPLITADVSGLVDCYTVTGIGSSSVAVERTGTPGPSCQAIAHIDVVVDFLTPTPVVLPPVEFLRTYSAKFLCGTFTEDGEGPVKPGNYATAVNVHNLQDSPADFTKKVVLSEREDEPRSPPTSPVTLTLGPDEALEVDCPDIRQLLGLPPGEQFIKGFVVVHSDSVELDVVAVYTAQFLDKDVECLSRSSEVVPAVEGFCPIGSTAIGVGQGGGMSIDVEYIQAKPGPPSGAGGQVLGSPATLASTSFGAALLAVGLTLGASRLLRARANGHRGSSEGHEEE